jgi:hypothetical protein
MTSHLIIGTAEIAHGRGRVCLDESFLEHGGKQPFKSLFSVDPDEEASIGDQKSDQKIIVLITLDEIQKLIQDIGEKGGNIGHSLSNRLFCPQDDFLKSLQENLLMRTVSEAYIGIARLIRIDLIEVLSELHGFVEHGTYSEIEQFLSAGGRSVIAISKQDVTILLEAVKKTFTSIVDQRLNMTETELPMAMESFNLPMNNRRFQEIVHDFHDPVFSHLIPG